MENNSRPHRCSTCNETFTRTSHLKRHSRLHTGGTTYRCHCGRSFSRNDGLARHMRHCQIAQRDVLAMDEFESIGATKQSRDKRACDTCAKLKLKCSSGLPCEPCRGKGLDCAYTRNGYIDPFERFRVPTTRSPQVPGETGDAIFAQLDGVQSIDTLERESGQPENESAEAYPYPQQAGFNAELTELSSLTFSEFSELDAVPPTMQPNMSELVPMDLSFDDFDNVAFANFPFSSLLDSSLSSTSCNFTEQPDLAAHVFQAPVIDTGQRPRHLVVEPSPAADDYLLRQLDPLEAKCVELRDVLMGVDSLFEKNDVSQFITRNHVLLCGQLYGRHLSRNMPILHPSTFMLTEAPTILVLAVVLGGACYGKNIIPMKTITNFAMGLLILIERQNHEIAMEAPRLSTVQASTIACCILTTSRRDTARKFVCVHLARNISMADRLGIFAPADAIDVGKPTQETFKWPEWIEQESRRRVACELFCLDMAFCIFMGKPPSFSAFTFQVQLPCCDRCWEASDPKTCLDNLRSLPQQMSLANGMSKLRGRGEAKLCLLNVSEYGMFTLIFALHCCLYRVIQEEPEPSPDSGLLQHLSHVFNPGNLLRQPLTGEEVTSLADTAVDMYGSEAMQQCNQALMRWRKSWDQGEGKRLRTVRGFSTDPLPFWYLAKLYQVLYLCQDLVGGDVDYEVPMKRSRHDQWKVELHDRVVSWLSEFRRQEPLVSAECNLNGTADDEEAASEALGLPMLMKP